MHRAAVFVPDMWKTAGKENSNIWVRRLLDIHVLTGQSPQFISINVYSLWIPVSIQKQTYTPMYKR